MLRCGSGEQSSRVQQALYGIFKSASLVCNSQHKIPGEILRMAREMLACYVLQRISWHVKDQRKSLTTVTRSRGKKCKQAVHH